MNPQPYTALNSCKFNQWMNQLNFAHLLSTLRNNFNIAMYSYSNKVPKCCKNPAVTC